jgi:hypothetical protein
MTKSPAKRLGRPTTAPKARQKATLNVRASPRLKKLLLEAADENDRSLSAEMEFRLEASFADQDTLTRALRLTLGSPPNTGLALLIGELLNRGTRWAETLGDGNWFDDADPFDSFKEALLAILERLQPKRWAPRDEERVRDYGRHFRLPLMLIELEMAGKRRPGQERPEWLGKLITELGPLAQRLAPPAEPPPSAETAPSEASKRRRRAA